MAGEPASQCRMSSGDGQGPFPSRLSDTAPSMVLSTMSCSSIANAGSDCSVGVRCLVLAWAEVITWEYTPCAHATPLKPPARPLGEAGLAYVAGVLGILAISGAKV